jgi:hypothetical protein
MGNPFYGEVFIYVHSSSLAKIFSVSQQYLFLLYFHEKRNHDNVCDIALCESLKISTRFRLV